MDSVQLLRTIHMRILLADDHPIILSGVSAILACSPYEVVGVANSGGAVLDLLPKLRPDVLVLDVAMNGQSGLDVLRVLRTRGDKRKVVLLTGTLADHEALEAVELGVDGIILKENGSTLLLTCLDAVAQGKRWIDREVMQRVLELKMQQSGDGSHPTLTRREHAVAELVARGLPNKTIAHQLGVTEGTVKVYLHRIYQKLGISNRTELALHIRARRRG